MKLIFLYGLPATGKLTVGEALAKRTGYKLFHNHLTVDLALSLFEFGTEPFVEFREVVWLSAFEQSARSGMPGLIFTFAPERSVRQSFITETQRIVTSHGGDVAFVELVCEPEELARRMSAPSRGRYQKLTSASLFHELRESGVFASPKMPRPALSIDTGINSASEAAESIAETLGLGS